MDARRRVELLEQIVQIEHMLRQESVQRVADIDAVLGELLEARH